MRRLCVLGVFALKGLGSRRFWPRNLGLQTLKPRLYIWGRTKGHSVSHSPLFFYGPWSPTCLGHTRTLIFFEGTTNQLTWKQFEIVFGTALPISIFALARQTENRGAGSIGLRQYLPKYLLQITVNTKYSTPLEYSISDILEHLMQSLCVSHQITQYKNITKHILDIKRSSIKVKWYDWYL